MSRRAATRSGDHHTCLETTPTPHFGGPVRPPGAPLVMIGGPKGSRLFDHAACIGGAAEPFPGAGSAVNPVDVVMSGAASVLVHGMPAVRVLETTLHGGVVVGGEPSVQIGGPSVVGVQIGEGTFLAYDPTARPAPRLFIVSYIAYVGPNATPKYAAKAKAQIESVWGGYHMVRGKLTEVSVDIRTSLDVADHGGYRGYDQVIVDDSVDRSNQQPGGGTGLQKTSDAERPNYIAAHEYGHTLGLDDQYIDVPLNAKDSVSVPDLSKTKNWKDNIMVTSWPNPTTGNPPHPYAEHYDELLDKANL